MFDIIFAVDNSLLFGKDNNLPWHYSKDLAYFKSKTENAVLICGYNTYLSLPSSVSSYGRTIIVISNNPVENAEWYKYNDIEKIFDRYKNRNIFVIGGKKLLDRIFIDIPYKINNIYITKINKIHEGNIYLEPNNFPNMKLIDVRREDIFDFCKYKINTKTHDEYSYLNLVNNIIENGNNANDRTGIGTRFIFGGQMRFDLSEQFPLLTTKKVFYRGVIEELLWFLRGETDSKILEEKNVNIWKLNTTREFLDNKGLTHLQEGDIGAGYGFQFKYFGDKYVDCNTEYINGKDQVAYVINEIKNNPDSRRILINLWNPNDIDKAVLPPCPTLYQFRVHDGKLSCSLYQRSGDMGLGIPFNIASASFMTYLFAKQCDLVPGELVHTIGDTHIYNNHIDALKKQLTRKPLPFPKLVIKDKKPIEEYTYEDFNMLGYISHPAIKMEMAV